MAQVSVGLTVNMTLNLLFPFNILMIQYNFAKVRFLFEYFNKYEKKMIASDLEVSKNHLIKALFNKVI